MSGCGDYTPESLVRNGPDVYHGKIMFDELFVEGMKSNAGLCDDIILLGVNLQAAEVQRRDKTSEFFFYTKIKRQISERPKKKKKKKLSHLE